MLLFEVAFYIIAILLLAAFYVVFLSAGITVIRLFQSWVKHKLISVTWSARFFITAVPALAVLAVLASYICNGKYHSAWVLIISAITIITLLKNTGIASGMGVRLDKGLALGFFPVGAAIKNFRRRYSGCVYVTERPASESFWFTAVYKNSLGRNCIDSNLLVKLE